MSHHSWLAIRSIRPLGPLLLGFFVLAGCQQASDRPDPATVAEYRAQFLLPEEPTGAIGIVELYERLAGQEGPASHPGNPSAGQAKKEAEAVVIGTIGGMPNPWGGSEPAYPWAEGQAKFFLSDCKIANEAAQHAEGHAGQDEDPIHQDQDHPREDGNHSHDDQHACPFCAKAGRHDAIAIVHFRDPNHKTIPIDARDLFDLRGGETVILRGTARLLGQGKAACPILFADGLYILKSP